MKKILSVILIAILTLSLTACGEKAPTNTTPKDYGAILAASRTEEEATSFPAVTSKDDEMAASVFEMTSINPDDVESFAMAFSFMNVSAYSVAIIMPASGKADTIKTALEGYVTMQQKNMENYLPDQYEIAKNAQVTKLKTGEVVLVMGENSDTVFENINNEIKK